MASPEFESQLVKEIEDITLQLEEWRPVVGMEKRYEVSNAGRVRSLNFRSSTGRTQVIKSYVQRSGYSLIKLGPKAKTCLVSRLVAASFCDGVDLDKEVNHVDGRKANNHAWNLEWTTSSENHKHAHRIGLKKALTGLRNGQCKLSDESVVKLLREYGEGNVTQAYLARKYGLSQPHVSDIVNGYRRNHASKEVSR